MFVYSGKCRQCETGLKTNEKDMAGKELFTGDIVVIFTDDYHPDGLTVVIAHQWKSYSNGKHELIDENPEPFVMGIETVCWTDDEWKVMKVKDHSDVIEGEHWKDFGFNYKST